MYGRFCRIARLAGSSHALRRAFDEIKHPVEMLRRAAKRPTRLGGHSAPGKAKIVRFQTQAHGVLEIGGRSELPDEHEQFHNLGVGKSL